MRIASLCDGLLSDQLPKLVILLYGVLQCPWIRLRPGGLPT